MKARTSEIDFADEETDQIARDMIAMNSAAAH
jgi:hypothetical protein